MPSTALSLLHCRNQQQELQPTPTPFILSVSVHDIHVQNILDIHALNLLDTTSVSVDPHKPKPELQHSIQQSSVSRVDRVLASIHSTNAASATIYAAVQLQP
jgi:hypothetical protein